MRVNVDEQAINEPRIRRMARRLAQMHGRPMNHHEVLGRLVSVWMLCYSRRSPVLCIEDIDIAADIEGFATIMVSEEMADATEGELSVYVRGVANRIAFLEKQSERGRRGGDAPKNPRKINGQQRVLFGDKANAFNDQKRTLDPAKANALGAESERLIQPKAYSPDLDQDQAPDLDQDHSGDVQTRAGANGSPSDAFEAHEATDGATAPNKSSQGKPERELPDQAYTLAHLLLQAIVRNHPSGRLAKSPERVREHTAHRWAETMDKLQRIDKFSWGEIEAMIHWSQRDAFWRGVILGADNLRDKWDKMAAQRNRPRSGAGGTQTSQLDVLDEHAAELERRAKEQKPDDCE